MTFRLWRCFLLKNSWVLTHDMYFHVIVYLGHIFPPLWPKLNAFKKCPTSAKLMNLFSSSSYPSFVMFRSIQNYLSIVFFLDFLKDCFCHCRVDHYERVFYQLRVAVADQEMIFLVCFIHTIGDEVTARHAAEAFLRLSTSLMFTLRALLFFA